MSDLNPDAKNKKGDDRPIAPAQSPTPHPSLKEGESFDSDYKAKLEYKDKKEKRELGWFGLFFGKGENANTNIIAFVLLVCVLATILMPAFGIEGLPLEGIIGVALGVFVEKMKMKK